MTKRKKIYCTLGPASLNKDFLRFAEKSKVSLVRLNLSHLSISNLISNIKFIKKNSNISKFVLIQKGSNKNQNQSKKKKFFKKIIKGNL